MHPDDIEAITLRKYGGVKPTHRGMVRAVRCVGFDIETVLAVPYILSMYGEEAGLDMVLPIKSGQGFLKVLDAAIAVDAQGRDGTLFGAHFLRYDLGVLTYDYIHSLGKRWQDFPNPEQITLSLPRRGEFHLRLGKVVFATLKRDHRTIHFIDTAAYFHTSLDKAAESLGLSIRKLRKPARLGQIKYSLRKIAPYAQQDARIAYELLKQIVRWWSQYGIRPAISAPQMAGRVFLHAFVKRPWVQVPKSVNTLALLSYHGGKNGFYRKPGWFQGTSYDIRSAYPWAMTQLPPMTQGQWTWHEGPPTKREQWSFTVVSGAMPKDLRYPILYTHDFKPIKAGEAFAETAVTGMEYLLLRELYPRWSPASATTVVWEWDEKDGYRDLKEYALEMYHKREQVRDDPVQNYLYKLLMNSLYGKFIARTPQIDGTTVGGQLFYPPVASWITALVRVHVTRMEHRSNAVHTSTDGLIVETGADSLGELQGDRLGALKKVNVGPCLILRNKLYLHFNKKRVLQSYALHGFQGTVTDLWTMMLSGKTTYTIERLLGWRESYRADRLPFSPVEREMTVKVPELAAVGRDTVKRGKFTLTKGVRT